MSCWWRTDAWNVWRDAAPFRPLFPAGVVGADGDRFDGPRPLSIAEQQWNENRNFHRERGHQRSFQHSTFRGRKVGECKRDPRDVGKTPFWHPPQLSNDGKHPPCRERAVRLNRNQERYERSSCGKLRTAVRVLCESIPLHRDLAVMKYHYSCHARAPVLASLLRCRSKKHTERLSARPLPAQTLLAHLYETDGRSVELTRQQ